MRVRRAGFVIASCVGCLAVCAPAAVGSPGAMYSGTISYQRSFTAPVSGECRNGGDISETVSENWQITFSGVPVATGQYAYVFGQLTGFMHEHLNCAPQDGYPNDSDLYASASAPVKVGVITKSDKDGQLTFDGIDTETNHETGLPGTATWDNTGYAGSETEPITLAPGGGWSLTVPPTGVTGKSFVIPWDYTLGSAPHKINPAEPNQTEPGTVSVSLHASPTGECKVPKLTGLSKNQAVSRLGKAGCSLGRVRTRFSNVKKGRVTGQSQKPGKTLQHGSKIAITLSKGRKH